MAYTGAWVCVLVMKGYKPKICHWCLYAKDITTPHTITDASTIRNQDAPFTLKSESTTPYLAPDANIAANPMAW